MGYADIMAIIILVLYNMVLLLLSPVLLLYLLWRFVVTGKSRAGLSERLGWMPAHKCAGSEPCLWLHAVSVGETVAAKPVWPALLDALPGWRLLHTTITDAGQEQAVKFVGEQGQVAFFPFDLLPCVWLALARAHPSLIVLVETELWPNFLAMAHLLGIPVLVVNGRISDRSLRRALRLLPLFRWMTSNITRFCMQSGEDAARIIRLGADPARVTVTGNAKFDQVATAVPLGEQILLRDALGLTRDEPVLLAGSTHPGEEEQVLRAFRRVKSADARVRLLIAPRHIQRAQEIEELVVAHGFAVARRTKLATMPVPPDAVIIMDTIGELGRAYALCTAAFIGGSLAPIGGHNVLEPLALGKPPLFGPYMSNFRDIAALVLEHELGAQVNDDAELAAQWLAYLVDAHRCRDIARRAAALVDANRGAAQRFAEEAVKLVGVVKSTR